MYSYCQHTFPMLYFGSMSSSALSVGGIAFLISPFLNKLVYSEYDGNYAIINLRLTALW